MRVNGVPRALKPTQERAIVALLAEPSVAAAARAANVGLRTLHQWLRDREFVREYREARRQAFGHAISMTQRYAPMAVNTLAKVMADPQAPFTAKVAAAAALLKFGRESIELDELVERVENLEGGPPPALPLPPTPTTPGEPTPDGDGRGDEDATDAPPEDGAQEAA
jgi:hypothetical protein